jgi:hypothetical protein
MPSARQPRSCVIVVENLPVPFDRRVWQEARRVHRPRRGGPHCPYRRGAEAADFLEGHPGAEKINLGALCNVLRQFHFHVVARFADPNCLLNASSPICRLQVFSFWAR